MHSIKTGNKSRRPNFEIRAPEIGIGVKNDSFVDLLIFFFFFLQTLMSSVTSMQFLNGFQTFSHKTILHYLQPVKSESIGMGNFERPISQKKRKSHI